MIKNFILLLIFLLCTQVAATFRLRNILLTDTGKSDNYNCLRVPVGVGEVRSKDAMNVYYAKMLWQGKTEPIWGGNFTPAVYVELYKIYKANLEGQDADGYTLMLNKLSDIVDRAIWSYALQKGAVKEGMLKKICFERFATEEELDDQVRDAEDFTKVVESDGGEGDVYNIKKFLSASLDIYELASYHFYKNNIFFDFSFINPFFDTTPRLCFYSLGGTGILDNIKQRRQKIEMVISGFYMVRDGEKEKAITYLNEGIELSTEKEKKDTVSQISQELATLALSDQGREITGESGMSLGQVCRIVAETLGGEVLKEYKNIILEYEKGVVKEQLPSQNVREAI